MSTAPPKNTDEPPSASAATSVAGEIAPSPAGIKAASVELANGDDATLIVEPLPLELPRTARRGTDVSHETRKRVPTSPRRRLILVAGIIAGAILATVVTLLVVGSGDDLKPASPRAPERDTTFAPISGPRVPESEAPRQVLTAPDATSPEAAPVAPTKQAEVAPAPLPSAAAEPVKTTEPLPTAPTKKKKFSKKRSPGGAASHYDPNSLFLGPR